ncbi:uncharacterized protein LTR77_007550 [Saxophila tyrrhenica]|uniref:Uncharacterized protein n=1 Tax=Saxophila tyrrhenica TaxID=1690608 RepID=A0AAV9P366_9PEZI|nr:hypothetical protein LTR77_007550 [Saxophila tyrrhenica]
MLMHYAAPQAFNTLKRAFKGMFKRNKKPTATSQQQTSQTQPQPQQQSDYSTSAAASPPPTSQPPPLQSPTPTSDAVAPQIPPIESGSPLNSATEPSKSLPPTHPLATGQQEEPQEAVPQDHGAQPGLVVREESSAAPAPAPVVRSVDGAEDNQLKSDQADVGRVSPVEPGLTVDGTRSGAVSAVDDGSRAEESLKNDSAVEHEQGKMEESNVVTDDRPPPPPAKENVPPPTTTQQQPTPNGTPAQPHDTLNRTSSSEEKVAITMEEPPPIRAVRAAPGMSATSGPLEEFPEGYYPK